MDRVFERILFKLYNGYDRMALHAAAGLHPGTSIRVYVGYCPPSATVG